MAYSTPYLNTAVVLIKRRDDPFVFNNIQDLEGKNMGVILGYGYLKKIESANIRKSFVKSLEQNLLKLVIGRIDLTMEEKLNAESVISLMPETVRDSVTIIDKPLEVKELHITLSRKTPNYQKLLDDFNNALKTMVDDGSYHRTLHSFQFPPLPVTKPSLLREP